MVAGADPTIPTAPTTLIFVYGTLKRGFGNHALIRDLMRTRDASFVGRFRTTETFPLVCGLYQIPFLINSPGSGHRVEGEVYAMTSRALARTDDLEGLSRGHYVRLPIEVASAEDGGVVAAEAYFAHPSYAMDLWRKAKEDGGGGAMESYSRKAAKGYLKIKDRPPNVTFLHLVRRFLPSSD